MRLIVPLNRLSRVLILCVLAVLCWRPVRAEDTKPDVSAIVRDTLKVSNDNHRIAMVWWVPTEYWDVALTKAGTVTKEQIAKITKTFEPYTVLGVCKGEVGGFGGITWESDAEIRSELQFVGMDGAKYKAVGKGELSPDLQNALEMMKPVLSNMLGPMGKNLNFYAFPAKNKSGEALANVKGDGSISVKLGDTQFAWRLPVGSFLPVRTCSKCGEKLDGAFKFCPYDGTALKR